MIEKKTNANTFSLKTLFWAVLVISVLLASALFVTKTMNNMFAGHVGPVVNPDDWPRPLKTVLESNVDAIDDIDVFEMNDFIDHRSIWSITGHMELIDEMIVAHAMLPVDRSHPMARKLLDSVRPEWHLPKFFESEWFATEGFGTQHIEGADQFLIAVDRNKRVTIDLHHNNF